MKNHMRGWNKIDIVCAFVLKTNHSRRKLICSRGSGVALLKFLTDLAILAKHAVKIASGKKIVSEPLVPEIGDSSPNCRSA